MGDTGFDALAQDLPFELGENGQHAGQGAAAGRVMSKASVSETKPIPSSASSLRLKHKVGKRTAPAVQPPDDDRIEFAAANDGNQVFAFGSLQSAGPGKRKKPDFVIFPVQASEDDLTAAPVTVQALKEAGFRSCSC